MNYEENGWISERVWANPITVFTKRRAVAFACDPDTDKRLANYLESVKAFEEMAAQQVREEYPILTKKWDHKLARRWSTAVSEHCLKQGADEFMYGAVVAAYRRVLDSLRQKRNRLMPVLRISLAHVAAIRLNVETRTLNGNWWIGFGWITPAEPTDLLNAAYLDIAKIEGKWWVRGVWMTPKESSN